MDTRKNKGISGAGLLVLVVFLFAVLWFTNMFENQSDRLTWSEFQTLVTGDNVDSISVIQNKNVPTGHVEIKLKKEDKDGKQVRYLYVSDINEVQDYLKENKLDYDMADVPQDTLFSTTILPVLLTLAGVMFIFMMMNRQGGNAGSKAMSFGKSRAKLSTDSDKKVTFDHVAGLKEEKEELEEIVDFLKEPKKYIQVGARIPKGVLLVGPPGTGKTLLAKAVAGEAGVPFFTISGSDFVEMFVGVGASRVRDLFEEAKKNAPCIIFIDEIDAVARRRGTGMGGGHDEREQTLNQLLAEMDGFDSSKGIFILAATNRPEVLDKALLRPGRLDRRITVDRPDKKGRIETLKVHSKDVLMDDTVDFDEIAMATSGLVGSDLANIINEAAIAAVKNGRNVVTQKDLLGAFDTVVAGKEKKERVLSKKEKQVVAYHEIGHALIRAIKNNSDPVQKITIIPHTNGSLGYVLNFPEEEKHLETKDELMTDLISLVGGRAAEEVVFGSVTNGAYDDIKKATNLAKTMITRYGMSDRFGLVALSTVEDEYLSGRASMNCAQATEAEVDDEVKKLIASCYEEAKQIIRDNREVMDQLARYLYDHETITGKEFMKIFREAKGIPEPVDTSLFSTSEKVAESVTFNEDGSYSSTVSGEPESDIWKNITNHSDDNNNEHHDNSDDKNDGTQE